MRRTIVLLIAAWSFMGCAGPTPPDLSTLGAEAWATDLAVLEETLTGSTPGFSETAGPGFTDSVAALRETIPGSEPHRILAGFARLAAMGRDGHTEIWLLQAGTGLRRLPVSLRWFSDGLRIVFAHPDFAHALGTRVVRLGAHSADSALAALAPYVSGDNRNEVLYSGPVYLRTPEVLLAAGVIETVESTSVVVEREEGVRDTLILPALDPDTVDIRSWHRSRPEESEAPLYLQRADEFYWYDVLEDSETLYLQINRSRNAPEGPSLEAFAEEFLAAADELGSRRLVVDLRHNVGGNFRLTEGLARGIGRHPGLGSEGRLFVLLSRQTFSAGVMLAVQLLHEAEPLLVGEVPRGNPNGSYDAGVVVLPESRLELEHTTELHRPLPENAHLDHLPVDVEIPLTFSAWVQGEDPVLAWVLGREEGFRR